MKIARYICWQLDSTLRPTMKRGLDIIPAQPELILHIATAKCPSISGTEHKNICTSGAMRLFCHARQHSNTE